MNNLRQIPGIGEAMEKDLRQLGIKSVAELKGKDPQKMYEQLQKIQGSKIDRCVLYVFRCAVYYARRTNPSVSRRLTPPLSKGRKNIKQDPEKLKWWNWKG